MRNIVTFDKYSEGDLKPSDMIKDYVKLVEEDIPTFFPEDKCVSYRHCPGCLDKNISSKFMKLGFNYVECASCHTLRVSPRPDDQALRRYYLESSARKFWREKLIRMTKGKRKEKIVRPRYEWILDSTQEYHSKASHILDLNTNQNIVLDEIASAKLFNRKTVVNPIISVDSSMYPQLEIIQTPMADVDLTEDVDVITLFEVIDHTSDVEELIQKAYAMLKKGGLCFITTILCSGFDIQILWDKAQNLIPPDRLNVFSVEGLDALLERHNFKCLEFSTPGILDVDIVANAYENDPTCNIPKFVKYIIENRDSSIRRGLQEFLESSLLSSYGRILLQKT